MNHILIGTLFDNKRRRNMEKATPYSNLKIFAHAKELNAIGENDSRTL